eukprot:1285751-Amphidinium_carterae.1
MHQLWAALPHQRQRRRRARQGPLRQPSSRLQGSQQRRSLLRSGPPADAPSASFIVLKGPPPNWSKNPICGPF